jgi:hypothetical protein
MRNLKLTPCGGPDQQRPGELIDGGATTYLSA